MARHEEVRAPWVAAAMEIWRMTNDLVPADYWSFVEAAERRRAARWFFAGSGRSGLVARMIAMRFMHIGLTSYVAGDATTPAIRPGDALLVVSGSGAGVANRHLGETALANAASLFLVTAAATSGLAAMAQHQLVLDSASSTQLGANLFEQSALVVLDSVVGVLAGDPAAARAALLGRHANLE